MSGKANCKELNQLFDASCSLLKESIADIVLKSSDNHFKIHSLAKLNLNDARQEVFEQKLNFLFDCLRPKYLNENLNLNLIDDDFNLLEENNKKLKSNLNDQFNSLDGELILSQNFEQLDSHFVSQNDLDDFETLKNDHPNNKLDDFDYLDTHDIFQFL